jgi:tetratricopeptide (TPR) repeat protein
VFAHKGVSLAELGMYRDAIEAFDKAVDLAPDLAEAWLGKGNVYYDQGRYPDAGEAYGRGLELDPKNDEA